MFIFLDKGKLKFSDFSLIWSDFFNVFVHRRTGSEVTKTNRRKLFAIHVEDIKMNGQKRQGQGMRTPPTPVNMPMLHPTRIPIPVTTHINTGMNVQEHVQEHALETSRILSKANEVLYKTPNKIDPSVSISQSQSSEQQCHYEPFIITTTTIPSTKVYFTQTRSGARSNISESLSNIPAQGSGDAAPKLLSNLFQRLDLRLSNFDTQLLNQNSRWQNMNQALQSQSVALQNQNQRMLSIEQQMLKINGLKNSVTRMEIKVNAIDSDLRQTNITINEYQHSKDTYSDLCEEM